MGRFNPKGLFTGAFIPNALLKYPGISAGAKLLYARLLQYADDYGCAWPSQDTLANELGITKQQIINNLNQLEKHKLIEREKATGKDVLSHRTCRYYFLKHSLFSTSGSKAEFTSGSKAEFTSGSKAEFTSGSKAEFTSLTKEDKNKEDKNKEDKNKENKRKTLDLLTIKEKKTVIQPESLKAQINQVFDFWKLLYSPRAKIDNKRRGKINARLREGWSVDDLKAAIRGVGKSPFHRGENKDGTKYLNLETVLRDSGQVEKFIKLDQEPDYRKLGVSRKGYEAGKEALELIRQEQEQQA